MANSTQAKVVISAADHTAAAIASARKNIAALGDQAEAISSKMGSLGLAITAAFSAGSVMHLVDMLDRLDDMAEKTGISVQSLSALRYAGEAVGTTQEQLATGLRKLSKLMAEAAGGNEEAAETFKTMGVDVRDSAGHLKATDKVLEELTQRFAGWNDGPEKSALALRVFGKSGEDMIPLLNLGKDGLRSMAAEAQALGAVFGADLAKNAADLNDNLKKIKLSSEAAAIAVAGPLIQALGDLSDAFIKARKSGEGYFGMVARSAALLPQIPDWATGLPGMKFAQLWQQAGQALAAPQLGDGTYAFGAMGGDGFGLPKDKTRAPVVKSGGSASAKRTAEQIAAEKELLEILKLKRTAASWAGDEVNRENTELAAYMKKEDEAILKLKRAAASWPGDAVNEENERLAELSKHIKTVAGDFDTLGATFSSSLEDAIVKGEDLRSVIQGLGQDILRIAVRKSVTEPLGNFVTDAVKGFGFSSLFSFLPGHAAGLDYVPYDNYLARLHKGERVLTAAENKAGAGQTINITMSPVIGSIASKDDVIQGMRAAMNQTLSVLARGQRFGGAAA